MRLVIVTGMSGSGKTTALKMLEDAGFYCVDNIPLSLVEKFVELVAMPENEIDKMVLGLDVRADVHFEEAHEILKALKDKGYPMEILFLDSSDSSLIKRYKETRRLHPLTPYGRVEDGVKKERQILEELRKASDYVIDTSNLLTRELKAELDRIFVQNESYNSLMVTVTSFGFKYGIPNDADLVFDVRFLPNPYYIDELRPKTGNDKEVQDFVMNHPESEEFLNKLTDMVKFLIPNYVKEGKYRLVIAIGCTGGRHRSVTLANALYDRLKDQGDYGIKLDHRDIYNKRG
ncbi:MAG: RNase adapter RapZ [Lachnospiraceae bacterium]|nr:RNase adapter RapZ [Lachnospiraceae bacterium]MCR5500252.1 RNase adapter RapZ [Acetatifactor sp.]MBO7340501.1 RNase adapter RapZ [Lachnospiraceae bacterium]MBP5264469.1 RNase adapter RapZ [Lachnospiraceae bacterium]MBP5668954.1 RNase adapter RapZ [Lachnospiraceae bacterium]